MDVRNRVASGRLSGPRVSTRTVEGEDAVTPQAPSSDLHDGAVGTSIAENVVQRALANRRSSYSGEVARLISAGVKVMQQSGSASPTISDTLAEAGLSNQAFYRHFQSKDEFLLAILDDGLRQLLSYLEHEMDKVADPIEKVKQWIRGVLTQSIRHEAAEATRGVLANSSHLLYTAADEFQRCEEMIELPLRRALVEAQAAGAIAPLDIELDVRAIYRLTMGSMEVSVARQRPFTEADVEHLFGFILRAIGLRRVAAPETLEEALPRRTGLAPERAGFGG